MKIAILIIISMFAAYGILEIIQKIIITRQLLKEDIPKQFVNSECNYTTPIERCPFCGGNTIQIFIDEEEGFYNVVCDSGKGGCGASTGYFDEEIKAINAWNTRDGINNNKWVEI